MFVQHLVKQELKVSTVPLVTRRGRQSESVSSEFLMRLFGCFVKLGLKFIRSKLIFSKTIIVTRCYFFITTAMIQKQIYFKFNRRSIPYEN